jgi:hypothetical protein
MSWRDFLFPVRERVVYKIIEVPSPKTQMRWDKETKDSVAMLAHHPGFTALTERLTLQRAVLISELSRSTNADKDVYLKAGIFWTEWLENIVSLATRKGSSKAFDPLQEELDAFREIDSQIERVGMD